MLNTPPLQIIVKWCLVSISTQNAMPAIRTLSCKLACHPKKGSLWPLNCYTLIAHSAKATSLLPTLPTCGSLTVVISSRVDLNKVKSRRQTRLLNKPSKCLWKMIQKLLLLQSLSRLIQEPKLRFSSCSFGGGFRRGCLAKRKFIQFRRRKKTQTILFIQNKPRFSNLVHHHHNFPN